MVNVAGSHFSHPQSSSEVTREEVTDGSQTAGFVSPQSVQPLSHVQLLATPWTAACEASLSFTNSQSLLKFISPELVMPSKHLILCRLLLFLPSIFPSIRVFSNELALFTSDDPRIGASASASVLPVNIQDWFPLGLTGLTSFKMFLKHFKT